MENPSNPFGESIEPVKDPLKNEPESRRFQPVTNKRNTMVIYGRKSFLEANLNKDNEFKTSWKNLLNKLKNPLKKTNLNPTGFNPLQTKKYTMVIYGRKIFRNQFK